MAVEAKRGCGYRKIGGLYLVSDGVGMPCDMLPVELTVCPCCGEGIKQTRGWTWIDPRKLFAPVNERRNQGGPDACTMRWCHVCPVSNPPERAGLVWIGTQFYPTPHAWMSEGRRLGFSRRISSIPRGLELGKTHVFVAHPRAATREVPSNKVLVFGQEEILHLTEEELCPGIFHVFIPQRIEQIVGDDQAQDFDFMEGLEKRGITPVIVPFDDPDHQGSCYDKVEEKELI